MWSMTRQKKQKKQQNRLARLQAHAINNWAVQLDRLTSVCFWDMDFCEEINVPPN